MKPFLSSTFQRTIHNKANRGGPYVGALLLTVALMWIEGSYRWLTSANPIHPDLIHILWINATLAFFFVTLVGLLPALYHRVLTTLFLGFFVAGFVLFAPLTMSHIQFSDLTFVRSWALLDVYLIRYGQYVTPALLVGVVPLLWVFLPISLPRHPKQAFQTALMTVLIALVGFSYMTNPRYSNRAEQSTHWEMLIYPDRPMTSRSRVGINQATLQGMLSEPLFLRPEEQNVLGSVANYLSENNTIQTRSSFSFRNRSLIVFQIEGLRDEVMNETVMPFVAGELRPNSVRFNHYYADLKEINNYGVNFPLLTGIPQQAHVNNTIERYATNEYPHSLPMLFNQRNYNTVAFHQFYSLAEDRFIDQVGFNVKFDYFGFSEPINNDYELINVSMNLISSPQRVFAYYHLNNPHVARTTPFVDDFVELAGSLERAQYFSEMRLIDQGIERAVQVLRENDQLNNTLIMVIGTNPRLNEDPIASNDRLSNYRTPFFIWANGSEQDVQQVMGPSDVIPSLMSFFGFRPDNHYIGRSVFAAGQNVVHFRDGSWISNAGYYDAHVQRFVITDPIYRTPYLDGYVEMTTERIQERQRIATLLLDRNYFAQEAI